MIEYNPSVRKLLEDIDRTKARVWALTNAYRNVCSFFFNSSHLLLCLYLNQHAERVLRILKLDDLIEGLVYSDYLTQDFLCKPEPGFYQMVNFSFL